MYSASQYRIQYEYLIAFTGTSKIIASSSDGIISIDDRINGDELVMEK